MVIGASVVYQVLSLGSYFTDGSLQILMSADAMDVLFDKKEKVI